MVWQRTSSQRGVTSTGAPLSSPATVGAARFKIGHDGLHAHVWRETPRISRRGRALPPAHLTRWDEDVSGPSRGPTARRHVASSCAGRPSRCHDGRTDEGQASWISAPLN
jgi:hypothetical protein